MGVQHVQYRFAALHGGYGGYLECFFRGNADGGFQWWILWWFV